MRLSAAAAAALFIVNLVCFVFVICLQCWWLSSLLSSSLTVLASSLCVASSGFFFGCCWCRLLHLWSCHWCLWCLRSSSAVAVETTYFVVGGGFVYVHWIHLLLFVVAFSLSIVGFIVGSGSFIVTVSVFVCHWLLRYFLFLHFLCFFLIFFM